MASLNAKQNIVQNIKKNNNYERINDIRKSKGL